MSPRRGARRCAAQSWPLDRVKAVKDAAGVSLNDVVLAMCAGALREYLDDNDALPDTPLVAMVPVSLRTDRDSVGGNMVGAVLCNLATHLDDPADRLNAERTIAAAPRPGVGGVTAAVEPSCAEHPAGLGQGNATAV